MVKKLRKIAEEKAASPAGLLDSDMAGMIKDSAQQIWLAGMGAFSKAQAEGGKVFEALIQEGQNLQRKTQGLAEEKISEVTGRMSNMAGEVSSRAGQHWDKLEALFEARTGKALGKLGVPTAADLQALSARVDELAAAVARLSPAAAPAAARKTVKTPAAQPRRAPAKKTASAAVPAAAPTPARPRAGAARRKAG
ncbi:MAG: phasin family protein [Rubrivivax sp.]